MSLPVDSAKSITEHVLAQWSKQRKQGKVVEDGGEA